MGGQLSLVAEVPNCEPVILSGVALMGSELRSPIEIVAIVHGKRSISDYAVGFLFSTVLSGVARRLH